MGFFVGALFALLQFQTIPVDYFGTHTGLSNSIVYDIYQDRDGFIWVATENGLNRFDGYEFEIFQHRDGDSTSIADNTVRTVFEDDLGRLWAGTFRGLSLFNRKTKKFVSFQLPPEFGINSTDIQKVFKDSLGNFWFLINSRLLEFDPVQLTFRLHETNLSVFSFVVDADDEIWLSTYGDKLYRSNITAPSDLEVIAEIEIPTLLSGINDIRLFSFNKVLSDRTEKWNTLPALSEPANTIQLLESRNGSIWVGSDSGLYILNEQTGSYTPQVYETPENSLSNSIRSLYEDKHGGIWIGTLNGLFYIDPNRKPFRTFDKAGMVMAIEAIGDDIWVNYFSQGLKKFDSSYKETGNSIIKWVERPGSDQIWDILPYTADEMILASNAGLFRFDHSRNRLLELEYPLEEFSGPVVFSLVPLKGVIFVLGQSVLHIIDRKNLNLIRSISFGKELSNPLLQDLVVFEQDTLVASESWGIFQIKNSAAEKWTLSTGQLNELENTSVWDLFISSGGSLWIGSNKGLFEYDTDGVLSKRVINGESNSIVFSVTEDTMGNLWLGTDKGIVKYETGSQRTSFFDVIDGTGSQEFNRRSSFQRGNEIFMGGMNGVTYFNPAEIRSNVLAPDVHITEIRAVSADNETSFNQTDRIELTWEKNTIEVEFVALNYSNPSQNRYRYQLLGYDPDWVDGSGDRAARYVQLPAGEYTFKVIASNNDGVWNEIGDEAKIIVKPPYWQTLWFKLVITAIVAALGIALYRYRIRQLLEVERVRLRIAGDLHDEIGSGLSGIALTGDILQSQAQKGEMKPELLSRITDNARSLASSLDAIVWLIDPNKEKLGDLIQKCRSVSNEILNGKEVNFAVDIDEDIRQKPLDSEFRRNVYLIFKESIHNIYKHADASEVEISFRNERESLELIISDNGTGYNRSGIVKGNGLDSLQRRADKIEGEIMMKSETGKGTLVFLRINIP